MLRNLILLIVVSACTTIFSQTHSLPVAVSPKETHTNKPILSSSKPTSEQELAIENEKLISRTKILLTEVNLECPEYATEPYILIESEKLKRLSISRKSKPESAILLSTLLVKNKCNPALSNEALNFDEATFNPLAYRFNFYAKTPIYYQVDNTDIIITILPQ